jgi:hypothetical protein
LAFGILPAVTRLSRHPTIQPTIVLALLCAILVALRIAGAHLHLCYDGSEPPVSLHVSDAGGEHSEHAHDGAPGETASAHGFEHDDRDVFVAGDALVKKGSGLADLALLAIVCLFLGFVALRSGSGRIPGLDLPLIRPARAFLRPPLRGPPRHA